MRYDRESTARPRPHAQLQRRSCSVRYAPRPAESVGPLTDADRGVARGVGGPHHGGAAGGQDEGDLGGLRGWEASVGVGWGQVLESVLGLVAVASRSASAVSRRSRVQLQPPTTHAPTFISACDMIIDGFSIHEMVPAGGVCVQGEGEWGWLDDVCKTHVLRRAAPRRMRGARSPAHPARRPPLPPLPRCAPPRWWPCAREGAGRGRGSCGS